MYLLTLYISTLYSVGIYMFLLEWRYAFFLHVYDMIWFGIRIICYAISMLHVCYEIFKNDMI